MQGYGDGIEPASHAGAAGYPAGGGRRGEGSRCEIEEVASDEGASTGSKGAGLLLAGLREQRGTGCGWTGGHGDEDVYVAVGKGFSSMDALAWALNQKPSGSIYLVHVFPEVQHIPTLLGMLPKDQVTPQQVESHMSQVRGKRRELLQKYLNLCHRSKVQVDTLLIESDLVAKAILELIPVLHIRKLIMGTSKSNLRMIRRGSGKTAGQVLKDAPEYCDVKIICEGQEVRTAVAVADEAGASSTSPPDMKEDNGGGKSVDEGRHNAGTPSSCNCFSRSFSRKFNI